MRPLATSRRSRPTHSLRVPRSLAWALRVSALLFALACCFSQASLGPDVARVATISALQRSHRAVFPAPAQVHTASDADAPAPSLAALPAPVCPVVAGAVLVEVLEESLPHVLLGAPRRGTARARAPPSA